MTLYQFNALDEGEQIEAIWERSVHLAFREDDVFQYELLQIDAFYVELKCHKDHDVMHGLRTFTTTTLLEPYLKQIDIPTPGE